MPESPPLKPALFLDRDGVLNQDRGFVHRWEDFVWVAGAREVLAAFNRAGWLVIDTSLAATYPVDKSQGG